MESKKKKKSSMCMFHIKFILGQIIYYFTKIVAFNFEIEKFRFLEVKNNPEIKRIDVYLKKE